MKKFFEKIYLKSIIKLRLDGLNNTEIAARLGISRMTVAKYVKSMKTTQINVIIKK